MLSFWIWSKLFIPALCLQSFEKKHFLNVNVSEEADIFYKKEKLYSQYTS